MAPQKITLFDMAEAVAGVASDCRANVERWDRDHPNQPLGPDSQWVRLARAFEAAHLTLSLMALDEDASRKFVASLMAREDGKMLTAMLTAPKHKAVEAKAEAAEPAEVAA